MDYSTRSTHEVRKGSYLKDKRIELWRTETTRDEDGFPIETVKKIGTLWAYYRHTSAREYYAAASVQFTDDAIFIINYRKDINIRTDYIIYRGERYDINAIDDYTGGRTDLKLTAKRHK